jgi:hypothetical protein
LHLDVLPADFNGDGIADLAGSDGNAEQNGRVAIVPGRGDGTFDSPVATRFRGHVLAVADVNADRQIDVIAASHAPPVALVVMRGNGDGTFEEPHTIDELDNISFAIVDDADGNGAADLLVGVEPNALRVYSGAVDMSFASAVTFETGLFPHGAAVADLDGDHRPDIVVANRNSQSLTLFFGRGALSFASREIRIDRAATDIRAADANGDGVADLVVSVRSGGEGTHGFDDGAVYVLTGHGDGSFNPRTSYRVARGAHRVVVGDFTADGTLDIATANWSAVYADDCGPSFKGVDSVSILPGLSDGTFGAAISFTLGPPADVEDDTFRNSVRSLHTVDVNGDKRQDLVVSNGSVLLSRSPAPNRPPHVDAGVDVVLNDRDAYLRAAASDPDGHLLTYRWTATRALRLPDVANPCIQGLEDGDHTFTVTVDDGQGGTATDAVTYRIGRRASSDPSGNRAASAPVSRRR